MNKHSHLLCINECVNELVPLWVCPLPVTLVLMNINIRLL